MVEDVRGPDLDGHRVPAVAGGAEVPISARSWSTACCKACGAGVWLASRARSRATQAASRGVCTGLTR